MSSAVSVNGDEQFFSLLQRNVSVAFLCKWHEPNNPRGQSVWHMMDSCLVVLG